MLRAIAYGLILSAIITVVLWFPTWFAITLIVAYVVLHHLVLWGIALIVTE